MSSMGTEARRRTRRRCVIALVGVMGLGAMGPGAVPDPVGAEEASAAQWVGSMQGTAGKSTRWVSGGSTMRGDFTFTVARNGQLRGFATAAYQPTFDTDRINALIGYAKGATAGALGAAGIFGGLAANQLNLIVGLKIDYPDPMPVRRGPITGKVRNGTISIAWASPDKDDGVPFRSILANLNKDKQLASGKLAIPMPFARDADISGGRLAVAQGGGKLTDKEGVTFESRTYWSAYKIGR
jgi:hypothetical protein